MQEMDDMALLREYAARNSEAAFETLVSRRVGFVYSAALRQVRDPHLAEDVTQAVFIILAKKAGTIRSGTILSGWLFKTVRFAAIAQTRAAVRRRQREQEAHMQTENQCSAPDPLWEQMSPLLDEALAQLGEKDREAILLRFFESKTLTEVGNFLGTGEDTARMRVNRAVEKLHRYFIKRGVRSTTAIIAGSISCNSLQVAPAALAKNATVAALAKGAAAGGSALPLVEGALKLMAWTKAKTAIVVSVVAILVAGTTTIAIKKIEAHQTRWWQVSRSGGFQRNYLRQEPPEVTIVPTKFPGDTGSYWGMAGGGVFVGVRHSLSRIIEIVYQAPDKNRIIYRTTVPPGDYDYIADLPHGSAEALQKEISKKFGLVGKFETVATNVLLLKVKSPGSPGLKPVRKSDANNYPPGEMLVSDGTMSNLAKHLEMQALQVPVIDQTGLNGNFAFDLKWDADRPETVNRALVEQLGLELVPSVEPVEMLVVEKTK